MIKTIGKETLTFNSEAYNYLLCKYQPQIITNEEENKKFLAVVEELMSRDNLTPEEDMLLALLVKLIEDFEEQFYSLNLSTPHSRLLHLMEARSLEKTDLFNLLSYQGITWQILNGELEITPDQARILGSFFHVNPNLFLEKF
jgi:HTH-type transcriptional regulator/antitoxin HigA